MIPQHGDYPSTISRVGYLLRSKGAFQVSVLPVILLLLEGCCSGDGGSAFCCPGRGGSWMSPRSGNLSGDDAAILSILEAIDRSYFGNRKFESAWDPSVAYLDFKASGETKRRCIEDAQGLPEMRLLWRRIEYLGDSCLARVEVCIQLAEKNETVSRGVCVFRRLDCGWRLKGLFPVCINLGHGPWKSIVSQEVRSIRNIREAMQPEAAIAPTWASDESLLLFMQLAIELYRKDGMFPLGDYLEYLSSNLPILRKAAHGTLVSTFGVDHGISGAEVPTQFEEAPDWYRRWCDWARVKYGPRAVDTKEVPLTK